MLFRILSFSSLIVFSMACKTTGNSSYLAGKGGGKIDGEACTSPALLAAQENDLRSLFKLGLDPDSDLKAASKLGMLMALAMELDPKQKAAAEANPKAFADAFLNKLGVNSWDAFEKIPYSIEVNGKPFPVGAKLADEIAKISDISAKAEFMAEVSSKLSGALVEAHYDPSAKQNLALLANTAGLVQALSTSSDADSKAFAKAVTLQMAALPFVSGVGTPSAADRVALVNAARAVDNSVFNDPLLSQEAREILGSAKAAVFSTVKALGIDTLAVGEAKPVQVFDMIQTSTGNDKSSAQKLYSTSVVTFAALGEELKPNTAETNAFKTRLNSISAADSQLRGELAAASNAIQTSTSAIDKARQGHAIVIDKLNASQKYIKQQAKAQLDSGRAAAARLKI